MATRRKIYKKIFISWSGDNSKQIARALKDSLENTIFKDTGLECFVSDVDISSGDDWWNKIKTELKKCKLGIACITKENLRAPWIYFESGAMIARDLKLIPVLVNCNINSLNGTPIATKHMVDFYNQEKFTQMVKTINRELNLLSISDASIELISADGYRLLVKNLALTLKQLKAMRVFNEKYIYPQKVNTVNLNTIYVSASISSITAEEYYQLRGFLLTLQPKLLELGFSKVICPLYHNPDYDNFDGNTKAIQENFVEMKQVDSMIVIYPKSLPSSVLVEIGYGLALCKKTVIFYKETLPYILQDAGTNISHIDSRKYSTFADIRHIIDSNGKQLFGDEED